MQAVKREKACTSLLLWRGGVCDRGHFEKYPLVDVEVASGQYRGTVAGERLRACGVQAARFDFSVASISRPNFLLIWAELIQNGALTHSTSSNSASAS